MKVSTFKVPIKITRDGDDVSMEIREDEKTLVRERQLGDEAESQIVKLAKQVSDNNDKQRMMAKRILLKSEDERESFILLEYLT